MKLAHFFAVLASGREDWQLPKEWAFCHRDFIREKNYFITDDLFSPSLVSENRATRSNEILVESDAGTIMAGVSLFHNYEMERGFLSFDLILCDVCIRQIVKIGVYFGFGQITV